MPTSTFRRSTWCLIGPNRLVDMEPCNSILLRDMNKHIKRTSRTVGTPPITISTTCHKPSLFSVASCASKSESTISKPSLSIGRRALPPGKSSHRVLIWLPPRARSHMQRVNSWDPKTAVIESILTLWSKTSEHYSTIHKTQRTAWQYTVARRCFTLITVVTRRIYLMNNCTQWRPVFTMVLRFKSRD